MYEDIINLEHPTSKKHPRMSMEARAAQFSPFAALTGFEDELEETGRLTDSKINLTEEEKTVIDSKLQTLLNKINEHPTATITYFVKDKLKEGGMYCVHKGDIKKIDCFEKKVVFMDDCSILIEDIFEVII